MKLILCVLLVVPVALAYETAPTAKILFDSDGNHFISGGFDSRNIRFSYNQFNNLVFQMQSNNSRGIPEFMVIKEAELKKRPVAQLAIVSYSAYENYTPENVSCAQNTDPNLRHLIDECYAKVLVRELTLDERKQIEEYKAQQQVKNVPFKVTFEKRQIKAKSAGLRAFGADFYEESNGYQSFYVQGTDRIKENYIWMVNKLAEESFTIEGMPADRDVDCRLSNLELKPTKCEGQIKLRKKLPEDDY